MLIRLLSLIVGSLCETAARKDRRPRRRTPYNSPQISAFSSQISDTLLLMSIVTKGGDRGETSLMYGRRVSKTDPRVEAYGAVDELTAALGLARSAPNASKMAEEILSIQRDLIIIMGELATAPEDLDRYARDGFKQTSGDMVECLERIIIDLEKDESLYPKDWVIPGANSFSAALDLARTTARHAERRVAGLTGANPEIIRYLNRLSDLCWLLARAAEKQFVRTDTDQR